MKKLLLLRAVIIAVIITIQFMALSCNDSNPVASTVNDIILISVQNKTEIILKLYQGEYLTHVPPKSNAKSVLCKPGTIEAIPEGLTVISFTVRNNKTYVYDNGVITEEN